MMTKAGLGAFCVAALVASPAFAAVTVSNQDTKSHTVVVDRGAQESRHDIAAGQSIQVKCPDNCGFRDLAFGFSRTAGGNAKLVIDKDAELHFAGGHGDMQMPDGTN